MLNEHVPPDQVLSNAASSIRLGALRGLSEYAEMYSLPSRAPVVRAEPTGTQSSRVWGHNLEVGMRARVLGDD